MDQWQLPVTETAGTCEILVQLLRFSIPEPTSWAELKIVARRLTEVCRHAGLSDVTGGTIAAGPHGRIEITVSRSMGVMGVEDG